MFHEKGSARYNAVINGMKRIDTTLDKKESGSIMGADSTILIVDDNESMRTVIRHALENAGYQNIISADDGSSAFAVAKAQKVSLIISDWNMWGMTGIELLKKVRTNDQIGSIPFLMLTVEALDVSRDVAFAHGVSDFLTKPFTAKRLVEKVKKLLGHAPDEN
ncbi:MAG: response regulator [Syntrophales bacterium]